MINVVTIILYLLAIILQSLTLSNKVRLPKLAMCVASYLAVLLHGFILYRWIDIAAGQNLNFFTLFSLATWLISLLILLTALRLPVENLGIFIFPLAIVSILLVLGFPTLDVIHTAANPKQLIHILLSILTFCVLCIAGLQAILLAIQEQQFRNKVAKNILIALPPLETMEIVLFRIIWLGFLLLSVVIISGLYFFHAVLFPDLIQKTVLAIIAWLIFAVLLGGRHYFGWRGRRAIYCTLAGVFLLIIVYFSSEIILEYLH